MDETTQDDANQGGSNGRDAHGRYLSGISGNPNGRPRKVFITPPFNFNTMMYDAINREIDAKRNGKIVKVPVYEALTTKLIEDALHGKPRDRMQIMRLLERTGVSGAVMRAQEIILEQEMAKDRARDERDEAFFRENEILLEQIRAYESGLLTEKEEAWERARQEAKARFEERWAREHPEEQASEKSPDDDLDIEREWQDRDDNFGVGGRNDPQPEPEPEPHRDGGSEPERDDRSNDGRIPDENHPGPRSGHDQGPSGVSGAGQPPDPEPDTSPPRPRDKHHGDGDLPPRS